MPTGWSEPGLSPLPDLASLNLVKPTVIPVVVVSGFLGSGKSTLINRWLGGSDNADTALIVNEIGEIGLDHLIVEHTREDTILLSNGCLCCAVQSDLVNTLRELLARRERAELPRYRRVIIETSGLADCVPIIQSFWSDPLQLSVYELDHLCVTVDAQLGIQTLASHHTARRQVAMADRLLLTKLDIDRDAGLELREQLAETESMPVQNAVDSSPFINRCAIVDSTPTHVPSSHSDGHLKDYQTATIRFAGVVNRKKLMTTLRRLCDDHGDGLLRVKGLVRFEEDTRSHAIQAVQHILATPAVVNHATEDSWIEFIALRELHSSAEQLAQRLHDAVAP